MINSGPGRINLEFKNLQRGLAQHNQSHHRWTSNEAFNPYRDILCFDGTSVQLKDNIGNDYIHANYIDGYKRDKAYILTQVIKLNNNIVTFLMTRSSRKRYILTKYTMISQCT